MFVQWCRFSHNRTRDPKTNPFQDKWIDYEKLPWKVFTVKISNFLFDFQMPSFGHFPGPHCPLSIYLVSQLRSYSPTIRQRCIAPVNFVRATNRIRGTRAFLLTVYPVTSYAGLSVDGVENLSLHDSGTPSAPKERFDLLSSHPAICSHVTWKFQAFQSVESRATSGHRIWSISDSLSCEFSITSNRYFELHTWKKKEGKEKTGGREPARNHVSIFQHFYDVLFFRRYCVPWE